MAISNIKYLPATKMPSFFNRSQRQVDVKSNIPATWWNIFAHQSEILNLLQTFPEAVSTLIRVSVATIDGKIL